MLVTEQHENLTPERILLEEQIDTFVLSQKQRQQKLESENRRNNFDIIDLAKKSKPLSTGIVDNIFTDNIKKHVSDDIVEEVRKNLHTMRLKLNALEIKKRYFILETMDFFRSKLSIGKLIPAVLLLKGTPQKKAILEFVIPTFISINKNVETLVSTNELFSPKSVHLDRGSLYSFASDVAKILIPLFKEKELQQFSNIISPVELLLKVLRSGNSVNGSNIYEKIIDDENLIRKTLLNFIVAIQSHESLFNYSLKRHGYYKLFLSKLTNKDRFDEFEPIIISKILAGCFIGNEQIKPDELLIDAMVHNKNFATSSTVKAKNRYIDKLAPSTIFKIINQFKIHLQQLSKTKVEKEFDDIQDLSVKFVLKKVWTGFSKLADDGISIITGPIEIVFNQLKDTFTRFIETEQKEEEKVRQTVNRHFTPIIPKRPESIDFLKNNYSIVNTDIIGFRGENEGANQKDFAYNSRFFKKGEITILEFTYCFKRLFQSLSSNKKVKVISYKKQKSIKEYYVAFIFGRYLICLGLTHYKTDKKELIQEKNQFPYILLFVESSEKKKGRIPSKVVTHKNKQKIFNEVIMGKDNAIDYYKSMLYILHLLPNEDWNSSASQSCIKFLIKELRILSENNK